MHDLASVGAGFLLAVLWFDLMFDVQVARRVDDVDAAVASISAYYRRVTTMARPMNRLVVAAMAVTLTGVIWEVASGNEQRWAASLSVLLAVPPIGLAAIRTVPNAVRLGQRTDSTQQQFDLARGILRDHLLCFAAIGALVTLQLATA
jgi:hypothetical protein